MILNIFEPNFLRSTECARAQNKERAKSKTVLNAQSYGDLMVLKSLTEFCHFNIDQSGEIL